MLTLTPGVSLVERRTDGSERSNWAFCHHPHPDNKQIFFFLSSFYVLPYFSWVLFYYIHYSWMKNSLYPEHSAFYSNTFMRFRDI